LKGTKKKEVTALLVSLKMMGAKRRKQELSVVSRVFRTIGPEKDKFQRGGEGR